MVLAVVFNLKKILKKIKLKKGMENGVRTLSAVIGHPYRAVLKNNKEN